MLRFFYYEESHEREYPTPHEWQWAERKLLREAQRFADPDKLVNWPNVYHYARNLSLGLEDLNRHGSDIPGLTEENPDDEFSWEFIPHDTSGVSEEWRRAYFDTLMFTAKAAGHCDGHMNEKNPQGKKILWPPEYVIGPSNPRPMPIPPKCPPAPREEDCIVVIPPAERYYRKILASKGFNQRQRVQTYLEYANFVELKRQPEDAPALYSMALAVATEGMDQKKLPFNPKTLVLEDNAAPPSANILDAITALANNKARNGDAASALPIYISLLKARRALSEKEPRAARPQPPEPKPKPSMYQRFVDLLGEPPYPPPPPDGTQPPWRSPAERCQEASLTLYIGEILYALNSHEDGIAWTREGVDISEEQLRAMTHLKNRDVQTPRSRCRECLHTGLDNWSLMATRLVAQERAKMDEKPGVLSFWGGDKKQADGRWEAENLVVLERMKRTQDLVEDVKRLDKGPLRFFTA